MRRSKLIAAVSDSASEVLLESFWICLPAVLRNRYDYSCLKWSSPFEIFECLSAMPTFELMDAMVILELECGDPTPWSLAQLGRDSRGYAASLALAFPEVYFVFLGGVSPIAQWDYPEKCKSIEWHHFVTWPSIMKLAEMIRHHSSSFRTLFDPTGLRTMLKLQLLQVAQGEKRGLFFRRCLEMRLQRHAAAADDEDDYTFLQGYALYRGGFCTSLLRSEEEFFHHLLSYERQPGHSSRLNLLISDWDLAYSDHEYSDNDGSDSSLLNKLDKSGGLELPVLVVSGYTEDSDVREFVARPDQDGLQRRLSISKPHSGIYEIIARIRDITSENVGTASSKGRRWQSIAESRPRISRSLAPDLGNISGKTGAAFFKKLLRSKTVPSVEVETESVHNRRHSLPFARALVVRDLLDRAITLKKRGASRVQEGILQAVLALDAKELLGEMSRTTGNEVTNLQVEGELTAELSWCGVDSEAEVDDRIKDLENEADDMEELELKFACSLSSMKSQKAKYESQKANHLYRVFDLMRAKYNEAGQIVAGERCHRKLLQWQAKIPETRRSLLDWYVSFATADGTSVRRILFCNAFFMLLFATLYSMFLWIHPIANLLARTQIAMAVGHSVFSFVEVQPAFDFVDRAMVERGLSEIYMLTYRLVVLCEILIAYLNLGMLISVLYRRLVRAGI